MPLSTKASVAVLWALLVLSLALAVLLRVILTWVAAPASWHYLVFGAASLLVCSPFLRRIPVRTGGAVAIGYLAILGIGYGLPWNSHDRFLIDFEKIAVGMGPDVVSEIMSGYMTGSGWPAGFVGESVQIAGGGSYRTDAAEGGALAIDGCEIYRHSDDARWNSDWGIVCYEAGLVSSTEFSPD